MTAARTRADTPASTQVGDDEAVYTDQQIRRFHAQAGAQARIAKYGVEPLQQQLYRGFMARFEREVNDAHPGLRERNSKDFAQRVEAALKSHMYLLSMKAAAARKARREAEATAMRYACSWCMQERGERFPTDATERTCKRHERNWTRRSRYQMARRIAAGATSGQVGYPAGVEQPIEQPVKQSA